MVFKLPLLLLLFWSAGRRTCSAAALINEATQAASASSDKQNTSVRMNSQQPHGHPPPADAHIVVRFGSAQVAIPPDWDEEGPTRGETLWSCLQLADTLCPRCAFVELGGPGLCAFDLAKRLPQLPVNLLLLQPSTSTDSSSRRQLAEYSSRLTGVGPNMQLDGDTSQYDSVRRVVLLVNLPRSSNSCSEGVFDAVRKLLAQGAVANAAVMLPARAQDCARQQLVAVVQAAVEAGLSAYWGGFDGLDVSGDLNRVINVDQFTQRSVNLFLTLSAVGTGRTSNSEASGAAGTEPNVHSNTRPPPPTVHVFVPLRIRRLADSGGRYSLKRQVCRFLLDTASTVNLTIHVVGWTPPARGILDRVHGNKQKIMISRHAVTKMESVKPTDVVVLLDATDSLAQLSSAELLGRYLSAGAPVFHVSVEAGLWPPPLVRYIPKFEEVLNPGKATSIPNKYVNSGCMIGRAAVLAKYFTDTEELIVAKNVTGASWLPQETFTGHKDWLYSDQVLLGTAFLGGNHYGISFDFQSQFCFNLYCAARYLRLACPWVVYNVTAAAAGGGDDSPPALFHGSGFMGKAYLEEIRGMLLGSGYKPDPEAQLLVDGAATRYGDFCGNISSGAPFKFEVPPKPLPRPLPRECICADTYSPLGLEYPPGCDAAAGEGALVYRLRKKLNA